MSTVDLPMRAVRLQAPGGPEQLVVAQIRGPPRRRARRSSVCTLPRSLATSSTGPRTEFPRSRRTSCPVWLRRSTCRDLGGCRPGGCRARRRSIGDGVCVRYAVLPVGFLASKPRRGGPRAQAQALDAGITHGRRSRARPTEKGERVLIRCRGRGRAASRGKRVSPDFGAHVIGTASAGERGIRAQRGSERKDRPGCDRRIDRAGRLVFDTVGGALLERAAGVLRPGGTIVTVADEPPEGLRPPSSSSSRTAPARGARSDRRSGRLATVRRFGVPARGRAGGASSGACSGQAAQVVLAVGA